MGNPEEPRQGWLGRLGGLTALVLGGVYAYGALLKSTELHGAGLSVKDTLPLVPLEQILVAGIGKALVYGAIFLFMALLVAVVVERRLRQEEREEPEGERFIGRLGTWLYQSPRWLKATLLLAWFYLILTSNWSILLVLGISILIGWVGESQDVRFGLFVLVSALSLAVATLTIAYFEPAPLPKAVLQTQDGVIEGRLIAATSGVYYIGLEDGRFQAVEASQTEEATFDPEANTHEDKTIFESLTGHSIKP